MEGPTEPRRMPTFFSEVPRLCEKHDVTSEGQAYNGISEDERCDELANLAAQAPNLPHDTGYAKEKATRP